MTRTTKILLFVGVILAIVSVVLMRRAQPDRVEDDEYFYTVEGDTPGTRCRGEVPLAPASAVPLPWPRGGSVRLVTKGSFSSHARDHQNWLNAPPSQRRSPPLVVEDAWLDQLNCAFAPTLARVITGAGLRVSEDGPRPGPLDGGDADAAFALSVLVGGNTETGGHHGGLTIRMEVTSLHRPPDVVIGTSTVALPTRPEAGSATGLIALALADVLRGAFDDLHRTLDNGTRKPVRELTLAFATDGLTTAQRAAIDPALVACAVDLGSSLGHEKLDEVNGLLRYRVRYRLQKFDEHETEADYIHSYASWLGDICDHGQCRCSTWRGPLDGYTSERTVDVAAKQVVVRFRRVSSAPAASAP